jgi:pimeloyl-ACP methyl ester carboxylesterase
MSDRLVELPSLDTRMDDVRAVLDAVGSERAVLFATGDGGFLATVFVATYPERAVGLVLFNSTPRLTRRPDMPWLRTRAEVEERLQLIIRAWGNLENMAEIMKVASPSASHEELLQVARRSLSAPASARAPPPPARTHPDLWSARAPARTGARIERVALGRCYPFATPSTSSP